MNCPECHEPKKLRNTKGATWKLICACPDLSDYEPETRATIVVLSKHPEIFEACKNSVNKFAPKEKKILVRDGNAIQSPEGWTTLQAPEGEKFVYARNANIGIAASTGDVFLMNDDCIFTHSKTLEIMQNVLNRHPEVGVLSPRIGGDVGEYHQGHCEKTLEYTDVRLCYVAVLLRRTMLDKVGLLDENFIGYGGEDVDHCRRIVNAGYKLGVTGKAIVKHGFGEHHRSSSFNRQELGTIDHLDKIAMDYYESKWGDRSIANFKP
jgi:GT2 family glycosyltransferase